MKTYGKMSIAFLYDTETDMIVNEPEGVCPYCYAYEQLEVEKR